MKKSKIIYEQLNPLRVFSFLYSFYVLSALGNVLFIEKNEYSNSVIIQFSVVCIIGYISFIFGYKYCNPLAKQIHYGNNQNFKIHKLLLFFTIIVSLLNYKYVISLINPFAASAYTDRIAKLADVSDFNGVASNFNDLTFLLIYLVLFYKSILNKKFNLLILIIGFLLLLTSIMSGSKSVVIFYVSLVLIIHNYNGNKINFKVLFPLFIVVYVFSIMISHVRNTTLLLEMLSNSKDLILDNILILSPFNSGELIVPKNLMKIIDSINKGEVSYSYGINILNDLFSFIPKFIWPDRPLNTSLYYAKTFFPSEFEKGLGFGNFILTEGYLSFGIIGVFIEMFIFGFFLKTAYFFFRNRQDSPLYIYMYVIFFQFFILYSVRTGFLISFKTVSLILAPFFLINLVARIKNDYFINNKILSK